MQRDSEQGRQKTGNFPPQTFQKGAKVVGGVFFIAASQVFSRNEDRIETNFL